MRNSICFLILLGLLACQAEEKAEVTDSKSPEYALVIHGGAGTILKENMTPEMESRYMSSLDTALSIGQGILEDGGEAIDAVEQVIRYLEDNPLFNAGRGAVFTHHGTNEMDASIMIGKTQNAGAVAGVSNVRHPISGARAVLEKSEHVLLASQGAEKFAKEQGLEIVDPSYFYTDRRWNSLQRIRDKIETELDHDEKKHGTVGAVALDMQGNIVAGTSTGGMTNKRFNRIGDSPIIGAGTYADNATCGVSCTGHGEFFIRYAVARNVAAQMEYGGKSLENSARHIINNVLVDKGGTGGLIAIDKDGHIAMTFNTPGMYRGYVTDQDKYIGIYKD